MRVKKRLARFTRMNPVEVDAEIKPLTPQSLDDGRVVVYKETIPSRFILQHLWQLIFDSVQHVQHVVTPLVGEIHD